MENQAQSAPLVQPTQASPIKNDNKGLKIFFGVILFMASVASAFFGGYYLNSFLKPEAETPIAIQPNITPTQSMPSIPTGDMPEANTVYLPGKEYFDDTLMALTEDTPRKILVATVTRQEVDKGANQATRVSFFDGKSWTRKTLTKNYDTTAIYTNSLVAGWQVNIDSSRVLKQNVTGKIIVDQNTMGFDTGILTNNITVRSLPGYTKFLSTGDGYLTINGTQVKAKILYTRIYSNDAKEIQFYDTPFGLTTYWLAFWDDKGNFYHIDSTNVDKPTDKYQTHQFGVKVDANGSVTKTFQVQVTNSPENPPSSFQITLGDPINQKISYTTDSSVNKAPNNSYTWFMSEGLGQIDSATPGFGVAEYIHN